MKVHIHKRFIDYRSHLLAPGPQDLPDDLARRIIADGKGVEVSEADVKIEQPAVEEKTIEELFQETQAAQPEVSVEPLDELKLTDLPSPAVGEVVGTDVVDPTPPMSPLQALAESDIPVDFPEREKLIVAGISTVASLKEANVKERLEAIPGFGPATVTKIGLAITDLP